MTESPHVIIVGAGFAGLSAVGGLRKAGLKVTVIDKNLYSTFQPLLYQVATGGLNPGDVSYAIGGFTVRRRTRYVRGDLAGIDAAARRVKLTDGRELGYDYLMLATGVAANYFGLPGAAENTFALYSRADAIVLRDHLMNGFERLSERSDPKSEFVITVVGGGATGVELAGTAAELRREVIQSTFPDVDPARVHVRLIEMAPELVMPFHPKLREYTRRQLVDRGVDIKLNTEIREVRPDCVILADGQELPTDLTVWAAGVAGPHSMADWGLPLGKGGRLLVGPDLRVEGSDRIFAIGDIALQPAGPGAAARAARDPARQARRRAGGAPGPRRADAALQLPRQGDDGHHRPPLRHRATAPGACGSPGRWRGWPGSACTCCTCSEAGTGSRR